MSSSYQFTVFTPTYNRAHLLHRVFNSLLSQTFTNFEWLIIDDGSTDNTKDIVDGFAKKANFPIKYHYKENGGKHTAINFGVKKAEGIFFLIADSDDAFKPKALEYFYNAWMLIPEERKELFQGVTGLCSDQNNNLIGTKYPTDIFDSDSSEVRYKYKVKGEKWGFIRLDILKDYPFLENSKFAPEGLIWRQISKKYKTRYINKILRVYFKPTNKDNLTNFTKHELKIEIMEGRKEHHIDILNNEIHYFKYCPICFIKSYINMSRYSENIIQDIGRLDNITTKFIVILFTPIGYLIKLRDNRLKGI